MFQVSQNIRAAASRSFRPQIEPCIGVRIKMLLLLWQDGSSDNLSYHHHHHHQINVHFLPRLIKGMDGCFPTASGRQSTFSNILDLSFSHSDASISRKSRLVTIRKLSIPGKVGASFWWWDALPHQPDGIREINKIIKSAYIFPVQESNQWRMLSQIAPSAMPRSPSESPIRIMLWRWLRLSK